LGDGRFINYDLFIDEDWGEGLEVGEGKREEGVEVECGE